MIEEFEITEIVTETKRLDHMHIMVLDVLERIDKTTECWASIRYLREAVGYSGGGAWFTVMLEVGAERGYWWLVRSEHRVFVALKRDGYEIDKGDRILRWMVRE